MSGPQSAPVCVVGDYVMYNAIASGGVAAVHFGRLRRRPGGFSRTVAIKRAHASARMRPEFRKVFVDEARIAARVTHANVVSTLDVIDEAGELLLVMEYVHGESLGRLLDEARTRGERVPPAIASAIFSGVLRGLHAAHEARGKRGEALDIVHRDVSPQNVLVGVDGLARVADFGIAKAAGRLQGTLTGQVKGKIAYMSPEQLRGAPLNRQTDIYAASVCLWETLTATRFAGTEEDEGIVDHTLFGEVQPPGRFAPGLPDRLDAIVLRGLARERAQRFSTAREMALELEAAVAPATALEVGSWVKMLASEALVAKAHVLETIETARTASAPQRARLGTIGLAAAVVLIAGVGALLVVRRPARQPDPGPRAETSASAGDPIASVPLEDSPRADLPEAPIPVTASPVHRRSRPPLVDRSPAGVDCTPPYTRDVTGHKTYKMGCL